MTKQDPARALSIGKPLAFVDLETTGSILGLDRIVEVGALKIMPDGKELEFESRVDPELAIATSTPYSKQQRLPTTNPWIFVSLATVLRAYLS